MKVAVTGGTGLVGRFIVRDLLSRGHEVTILSRTKPPPDVFARPVAHLPYNLDQEPPDLSGKEALVHAAFDHVPGRYRGGEGDDPGSFLRRNLEGSAALFVAAAAAGVRDVVFLSSRAVYGDGHHLEGHPLTEDAALLPDTLYGHAKAEAEAALAGFGTRFRSAVSLRATGVYGPAGPGGRHKWTDLFRDFRAGKVVAPRIGTEVHGDDVADAIRLVIGAGASGPFNCSDLVLDHRDLLAEVARLTGLPRPLPEPARTVPGLMATDKLRALGWRPRGQAGLVQALPGMIAEAFDRD